VYVQWHRRDNSGRVEIFRLQDGKVSTDYVHGTETAINLPGLLSFSSVSLRGADVFRCRPEDGLAFSKHAPQNQPQPLGGLPAVAPPILLGEVGVYGSLDGKLCVVGLNGGKSWSFATPWGRAITAPAAVCDGRVYFGCEDGYLYVLAPGGKAPLPTADLGLQRIRSPLSGPRAGPQFDWFTNYGNLANTNANRQGLTPPLRMKWIRRYEGTFKHLPVCGGGRLYIHTAEGQIIAVEQETGRLLWRQYFPNVYLSFTAPLYVAERLLVPQAGMKQCRVRCLDAATGRLRWEAPFSGSPSWSRQAPPVAYKNLAIYAFGSGRYAPQGSAKPFVMQEAPRPAADNAEVMSWIYGHDNPYYPRDNRPLLRAWDIDTGREAWSKDFSSFGCGGNDCGLCLLDGTLYYSTFFGYDAGRKGADRPRGLTAAIDPLTGSVRWSTTKYYVTAGCTISARDGRLYLGGYNKPGPQTRNRYVWCLDARDGSLVWQSEPVASAVNVVSIGPQFLFSNASGRDGHVLDRATGKILSRFNYGYACTRFTLSEPYVLGPNMDLVDLAGGNRLASSGPPLEGRECVGSIVSNGRLYYTAQASGLQVCLVGSERGAEEK
jgi:outer membrane protein assembly factor BamB